MVTVTVSAFQTQFPEFTESAADVQQALDEALLIHSIRALATYFCAAHLLVFDQKVAAGTVPTTEISQRGAGPLSARYLTQAESGKEAFFTSTSYGRRFLTLEKRSARASIGAMVV